MEVANPELLQDEIDDDEEFEDETLTERLVGLTEMFPERVRNASTVAFQLGLQGVKKGYSFTRSAMWITTTSFVILILPVLFETEMAQMEQAQIQKQRQILLGPNAAGAPGGLIPGGMTPPIPGTAVAQPTPGR
ncbi:putative mitochondrial import receptor subunit TOM22-like [Apostichopus japonicus]|uniref:Mitochondrial import receptor subunit TOM22 homolog n=1 Tax=Stichopus japonicus TaxID=307972 RepID=A0A2G8LC14_STIJA|nr:putative mitochondrial import receptor subunit TOM22-like [Apostichopus japonicus]